MATKIIVSYDGTDNDRDALALGTLLVGRERVARARVRPARHEARERPRAARRERGRGAARSRRRLARHPDIPRTSCSAPRLPTGCASLAVAEQADVIVFGSEYRTAPGHVDPQASARRLLDGGPVALAFAPAGFAADRLRGRRRSPRSARTATRARCETARGARRPGSAPRSSSTAAGGVDFARRRLEAGHRHRPGDDQRGRRVPDRAHPLPGARAPARRRRGLRRVMEPAGRSSGRSARSCPRRASACAGVSVDATGGSSASSWSQRSPRRSAASPSAATAATRARLPAASSSATRTSRAAPRTGTAAKQQQPSAATPPPTSRESSRSASAWAS